MFNKKENKINIEKIHSKYCLSDQKGNNIYVEASKERVSINTFRNKQPFYFILSKKEKVRDIANLILKATELE